MSKTMSSGDNPRTVKLLCPSLHKIVSFAASDDQKLDLGSIAKAFGLDPSTLKLNGHFISRGVDFVASSVTWRSLLKFFSAKGLSTGKHDRDALIVDGKLSKSRTKRHERETEDGKLRDNLLQENKKLRGIDSGYEDVGQSGESNAAGLKRKPMLKEINLFKKLKINNASSEAEERRDNKYQSIVSSGKVRCNPMIGPLKRIREDDMVIAAPFKKIR